MYEPPLTTPILSPFKTTMSPPPPPLQYSPNTALLFWKKGREPKLRGVTVQERKRSRTKNSSELRAIYLSIPKKDTEKLLINMKIDSVNFTVNSLREFVTYGTYAIHENNIQVKK